MPSRLGDTHRRIAFVLAMACALVTAGGCAADTDGDVASLKTGGDTGQAKSPQRQAADHFYSCLVDASVPATIDVWDNGDAYVTVNSEDHDVMMIIPNQGGIMGAGKSGGEFSEADNAIFQEHSASDTYLLMVDGTDHTDKLEACHEESGYADPGLQADPAQELRDKQQIVEATNQWIACARENGFPRLEDVTAEADGYDTYPQATIPLSTTPEALRALLEACPTFDEERATRQQQPDFDWTKDDVPDPSVGIEMPPEVGGTPSTDATDATGGDGPSVPPAVAQFTKLSEILSEKAQAFWDSQDNGGYAVATQAD
jgi:hypothetical protein